MHEVDAIYTSIASTGRRILQSGGAVDAHLNDLAHDTRRSIALLLRPSAAVCTRIASALHALKTRHPEIYAYPPCDLHITLLDLLGGRSDFVCSVELAQRYADCIRSAVQGVPPVSIAFRGLIAGEGAVVGKGYPDPALEVLRQRIRAALRKAALPLEERYETHSCHITATRYPEPIRQPAHFLRDVDAFADTDFGSTTISALELTHHDWYDTRKALLASLVL